MDKLLVRWDKRQKDIYCKFPCREDGALMFNWITGQFFHFDDMAAGVNAIAEGHGHFGKSLHAELEARGYDITTLRFEIKRKIK